MGGGGYGGVEVWRVWGCGGVEGMGMWMCGSMEGDMEGGMKSTRIVSVHTIRLCTHT